jgi:hypothetical protein
MTRRTLLVVRPPVHPSYEHLRQNVGYNEHVPQGSIPIHADSRRRKLHSRIYGTACIPSSPVEMLHDTLSIHNMRACLKREMQMQGRSDAHMDADVVDAQCNRMCLH